MITVTARSAFSDSCLNPNQKQPQPFERKKVRKSSPSSRRVSDL